MAPEINLLPELPEEEIKRSAYTRRVNFAAITALLVVGALLLGVFGYWLFLAANVERLQNQTENAEQEIIEQNRKEITRRSLVGRLEGAKDFVSSVIPYSGAVDKVLQFFKGSEVGIRGTDFKEDGDISIQGDFRDTGRFNSLASKFISEKEADTFASVTLVSLTREEDEETGEPGDYVFTLGVNFLKKGLPGATGSSQ